MKEVGIKYSMCELIRDVIKYCASNFDMGNNVRDKFVINNLT